MKARACTAFVTVGVLWLSAASVLAQTAAPSTPNVLQSTLFPSNYSIYGLNLREYAGQTTSNGMGLFVTCDSGEIAVGGFCEEKSNIDPEPNALLTSGVGTTRSAACRWKNKGLYRVVASCLAITAIKGDSEKGSYSINQALK